MAALCIHAYHNVSVIDKACQWNIPKQAGGADHKALKDIFPPKKADFCAVKRVATAEEIKNFQVNLYGNIVGFSWLLQPEPQSEAFIIPDIDCIIYSVAFIEAEDKALFVCNRLAITEEVRNSITQSTIGQSKNPNWLVARKYRLTAIHFGEVLAACKRDRYPPSLFKNLLGDYDVTGVQAVQWGLQHEELGLDAFTLAMGLQVVPTGLWMDMCGFLGASPDGLVGDNAIIEVKCPFKYRNMSLSSALCEDHTYIIYKDENNETQINKNHIYNPRAAVHYQKRAMLSGNLDTRGSGNNRNI
uniref:YqaJ viral recombinase domain-containing protein n=1 Tax=Anoplophora glabripennis TaxID=217634 RepID=V5GT43_ANOGL